MSPKVKSFCIRFSVILLVLAGTMAFLSCMSQAPDNIGLKNGKLTNCPSTPNCVCSQQDSTADSHFIEPLSYGSLSREEVMAHIKTAISSMPRTEIISEDDTYLHLVCTSLVFRFKDDLEIFIDTENKMIHYRSASRVGHSDLGVNRKRVDELKKKLSALLK